MHQPLRWMRWFLLSVLLSLLACNSQIHLSAGEQSASAGDVLACANCHRQRSEHFAHSGMGQSWRLPPFQAGRHGLLASLPAQFTHAASGRRYELWLEAGQLWFADSASTETAASARTELPVAGVIGSGTHAEVLYYQTPDHALFQLPIAWYAELNGFAMAPGFDRADHEGLSRPIRRECVFCHSAYPNLADGADQHAAPHLFPSGMPGSVDCARCHANGSEHARLAADNAPYDLIVESMLTPAEMVPAAKRAVCQQCHWQPSVALAGPRRLGRGDFSFRAGETLDAYQWHVDVEAPDHGSSARFEINHSAWRLAQSPCEQAGLSCTDCHDVHRPLQADPRLARSDQVCARCHNARQVQSAHPALASGQACVSCHMPKRRAQDVVHAVMTDHRLQVPDSAEQAVAKLPEQDPSIERVRFLNLDHGDHSELPLYSALTQVRNGLNLDVAIPNLKAAIPTDPEPAEAVLRTLIPAMLVRGDAEFPDYLARLLALAPDDAQALGWQGVWLIRQGQYQAAARSLRAAMKKQPLVYEHPVNLAQALWRLEQPAAALTALDTALALRPNAATTWRLRARILEAMGDRPGADAARQQVQRWQSPAASQITAQ